MPSRAPRNAQAAAAKAPVPVTVLDGVGGQLPGEDGSFDAGVAALVLCTIPDPQQGLAELFRVIRPEGELPSMSTSSRIAVGGALLAAFIFCRPDQAADHPHLP